MCHHKRKGSPETRGMTMKAFAALLLLLLAACNQIKEIEPEPVKAEIAPEEIQLSWSLIESNGLLVPVLCRNDTDEYTFLPPSLYTRWLACASSLRGT